MKIAIIGAGPAGITAAYQISKLIPDGKIESLDLYEASDQVGGLSRSLNMFDQIVDLGPHRFFSNDPIINKLWLEVVGDEYEMVDRITRIYYNNKFFYYPLKAFNALFNLGIFEAARCMLSYGKEKIVPRNSDDTFEDWVSSRFGKRLFEIFFKTYTEKLWGIKCTDLDPDFASQRIKKLSLFEAIKNAIFSGKGNTHKTLVDQFAYPKYGTGMVYEKMAQEIEKNGGKIHLNTPVERVITENNKVKSLELSNNQIKNYDHIISSMPISLLVTKLPEVPADIKSNANSLKFRNTILVYLEVDNKDLFEDQWLYIHDKEVLTGRITNFRNWSPTLYKDKNTTILCLEYWCYSEDSFWSLSDNELIELAKKEIVKTKLIKNSKILNGSVFKIPRCYPVYFRNYKSLLKPVENYLSSINNLQVIGRYGAYKYNNQDHSILMGVLAAENIAENKKHNLWEINTDYENYQESSTITKAGLVMSDKKES